MKQLRTYISAALMLAACGQDAAGPSLPPDVGAAGDARLGATLEFIRERYDVPALAAMLVRGDAVVEMDAVGHRAVGFGETVTTDDLWHIGSITKAMTATLAGVLVERGDLSWSTTVAEVFPDLVGTMKNEYASVRVDELLSHTSGLPDDVTGVPSWPTLDSDPAPMKPKRRQFAAELLELDPAGSVGTYLYSNGGYVVAGAMMEEITGELWEDLLRTELFGPLGMTASGFGAPGTPGTRDQPWGHSPTAGGWDPVAPGAGADNPAALGPAGTVHTSLADYARYMVAHLAGARGTDGIVTAATFTKLHTAAPGTEYGLGWGVSTRSWANGRTLAHSGSNLRWYASVWLAPERDFAVFSVTNAGGDDAAEATDVAIQALIQRHDAKFGQ